VARRNDRRRPRQEERNKIILAAGHVPVRVMYYLPVRANAQRTQRKIIAASEADGAAYVGDHAWDCIEDHSGVDLKAALLEFIPASTG